MPIQENRQGRDKRGHFTNGNTIGRSTRFRQGESGNPRGRPFAVERYVDTFRQRGLGVADCRRMLANPSARPAERKAAQWLLIALLAPHPIPTRNPDKARRLYRRWYAKPYSHLCEILLDLPETPELREAARLRLNRFLTV